MDDLVSIIIVSYNTKEYLRFCLQSIADSNISLPYEVIVVDNDSRDGSPDMVSQEFPSARLIKNSANWGFGTANNIGMRAARGTFYFLLNSDAELKQGALENLVKTMKARSKCGMVGPMVTYQNGEIQYTFGPDITLPIIAQRLFSFLVPGALFSKLRALRNRKLNERSSAVQVDCLCAPALMVSKQLVEDVGGFDEKLFLYVEDAEWCRRARKKGWRLWYAPEVSVLHHEGASSGGSGNQLSVHAMKGILYYYGKHNGAARLLLLRILMAWAGLLRVCLGLYEYLFRSAQNDGSNLAYGKKLLQISCVPFSRLARLGTR